MSGLGRRFAALSILAIALSVGLVGGPAVLAAPLAPRSVPSGVNDEAWSDFDNDGFDDLAVGAPFDDVGTVAGAGVVHVLYGSATGLTATGSQVWHQDKPNVADVAEAGDHFGWSLARGDFDGNGFGDLAIGVPDEDLDPDDPVVDFGGVNVLYGSPAGLIAKAAQPLVGFAAHLPSTAHDRMGVALAPLDVFDTATRAAGGIWPNGFTHEDGTDLAIGIPGRDDGQGGVWLVGGGWLDPTTSTRAEALPVFVKLPGCHIGQALAPGDFDLDVRDDLAIGAPSCDITLGTAGSGDDAGAVLVLRNANQSQVDILFQGVGLRGQPEAGDRLGRSVGANDLNGDGIDDLFAGAPGEDLGTSADAGVVSVALRSADRTHWELPASDINRRILGGSNVAGAQFGAALATGGLNDTDRGLAIGAPGDQVGSSAGAGTVWVSAGDAPVQAWSQDSPGILNVAEAGDEFGGMLAVGDFDGTNFGDLAIGVSREDVTGLTDAGAVAVLYAASNGQLSATGDDLWTQDSSGIGEQAQSGDRFGFSGH